MKPGTNNVDMLATAREAQWSAPSSIGADSMKLVAPAKVNLFLDVRERRSDGYHEVINVMHSLALHDVIYLNFCPAEHEAEPGSITTTPAIIAQLPEKNGKLAISLETVIKDCGSPAGTEVDAHFPLADASDDPRANLAFRAIESFAKNLQEADPSANKPGTFSIRIEKHIPAQAGLGGGSADAAAALIGAARAWEVPLSHKAVIKTAAELGADVPFFLQGGCALLEGTGGLIRHTLTPMKTPLVLVKPPAGVSTTRAYAAFDEHPIELSSNITAQAERVRDAREVPLANNMTDAACSVLPSLRDILAWLTEQGGVCIRDNQPQTLLCGSGSATFALTESYTDALRIAAAAQQQGWWSRATTLSSLPAAQVL